jgi:hypothetical protein
MANGRNPGAARAGRSKKEQLFDAVHFGASYESDLDIALKELEGPILEHALRSGARAGALVLYHEIKARTATFKEGEGVIYDAIYHWFDDKRSTATRKTYMVGVNKSKAPHWHNVEYGHWRVNVVFRDKVTGGIVPTRRRLTSPKWVPAAPYLRPAWDAKRDDAVRAIGQRVRVRIQELMYGGPQND